MSTNHIFYNANAEMLYQSSDNIVILNENSPSFSNNISVAQSSDCRTVPIIDAQLINVPFTANTLTEAIKNMQIAIQNEAKKYTVQPDEKAGGATFYKFEFHGLVKDEGSIIVKC